jgi:predicted double-glycine peptidase
MKTALILALAGLSIAVAGCSNTTDTSSATSDDALTRHRLATGLPADTLPVPIRHQPNGYTCGPTSLAAILSFWQVAEITPSALGHKIGTSHNGTEPFDVRDGAKGYGLAAEMRGQISEDLDTATKNKIGELKNATIEDLRKALCTGRYATADCKPETVILDVQAWGSDEPDYSEQWDDGHYVVLIGMDDTNVYIMDPDATDTTTDKAYAFFPINDPKKGLEARWHDYFGDIPSGQTLPSEAQRFSHGAIFIKPGTKGHARKTFEDRHVAASQRVLEMP